MTRGALKLRLDSLSRLARGPAQSGFNKKLQLELLLFQRSRGVASASAAATALLRRD